MTANLVLGEKFTVETAPTTTRGSPSVTQLAGGNIVMVFPSVSAADDDLNSVSAQIFTAGGIKIGGEIQLNTTEAGVENVPLISALPGGGFIAAWTSSDQTGQSTDVFVRGQAFDAAGNKVGGELAYTTTTVFTEFNRDIAFLADGKLVVSWLDTAAKKMRAQVFDTDGAAVGATFVVASGLPLNAQAEIVTRADGSFGIITNHTDGLTYLRNCSSAGAALGGHISLGGDYSGWTFEALPDGGMVAVGVIALNGRQDIYLQRFASNGAQVGGQVLVNDPDNTYNELPDLAVFADGSFTVAWHRPSFYVNGQGFIISEGDGVTVQTFDASGAKVGGQSWLDRTGGRQYFGVDIEALAGGGFFAGWYDPRFNAQDTDVTGIRARIFGPNHAPEITSGNGATATYTVFENTAAVTTATASDGDVNAKLVWSISGGADAAFFTINAQTGALAFRSAPDFEGTAFHANTYAVQIAVSDGYATDVQSVTVNVADIFEAIVWTGTSGADTISGSDFADSFTGLGGNDHITALGGDDVIDGGTGADTMIGGSGNDRYYVDNAGDMVVEEPAAGTADEVITTVSYTLAANVERLTLGGSAGLVVSGNAQDNLITGNRGANTMFGMDGNDQIYSGAGNDVVDGGAGHDFLGGDAGNDTLIGGDGNDQLVGHANNDTLSGGAGNDLLDGGTGIDAMTGGTGDDWYWVDNVSDTVTEQADEGEDLVLASVSTVLSANVEMLTLLGTSGLAGTGNTLANTIYGNDGSNVLSGLGENDRLFGLSGNDTLDGGIGDDALDGGAGNDLFVIDSLGDVVIELEGQGTDTIRTSISLGALADNVENLILAGTADLFGTGNALANALTGNNGANVLSGLDGKDVLIGGAGNDRLLGGAEADKLTGGTGADAFVFDTLGTTTDRDTITDFASGMDRIELTRAAFTAFAVDPAGQISASAFHIGTAAASADHHLIYNPANGALLYDADGKGGAAQIQIATLTGLPALAATDLWLI
ncbi:MAG: hypothetical protein Q8R81_01660 [Novosphingobium sp.]|uniref:hypothetical protein n=1 Tax=Novosphingobium sp. TaxID=1874826 RepID=UPI0027370FDC|nr:hypothetical protein [Novosphingobium sp.]MDP3549083.1 hypothetical protein [Novosphingobium sp.]